MRVSMEFWASLFVFLASISAILAQYVQESELVINGTLPMFHTDANYVCATIDWWPDDKCNYNHCPWGSSSALNLDLSHPILTKAVQAFEHLRIRVGGSLQDQVVYNVGDFSGLCHPFTKMKGRLFGFSKGCLRMDRWDELNQFFVKTRAIVTFGLNALPGRHQIKKGAWEGNWNAGNALDFMKYTVSKGYQIHSWEFGNELSGKGIGAMVHVEQYASDLIKLRGIIDNLYREVPHKPLLVAPGGFFDKEWFAKLLKVSGSKVVDVMTIHLYNLGPGIDPNLVTKILDPHFLNRASITFDDFQQTIKASGPWASSWIGESGGAYNSGGLHVSDTFVNSFWYLDQLAMAAKYHTEVYCRQTLIGGNYGLLNKTTFVPNPDYYSALLWHRLMGTGVLSVERRSVGPHLRTYAHCSKGKLIPKFKSFAVDERPGEQWIRLNKKFGDNEEIKVEVTMFQDNVPPAKDGVVTTDNDLELYISMVVDIFKDEENGILEFVCNVWPDSVEIEKVFMRDQDGMSGKPYLGPPFDDLDDELQTSLYDFLETRGINDELALFLHKCMQHKSKNEYIRWMGSVESFVARKSKPKLTSLQDAV